MKKLFTAILCSLGISGCSSHDSPEKFTREFVQYLEKASSQLKVVVKQPLELSIVFAAGNQQSVFLDNAYTAYKAAPGEKSAIIGKYADALLETGVGLAKVSKDRITPVIKDRPWLSEVRESLKGRGSTDLPEHVFDELNEDLVVVYAEDSPKNLRYLIASDLADAGITRGEIRSLAIKNLKDLLPPIKPEGGNGIFMLTAGGDYDASLILFERIWTERQLPVKGDYVMAVPSRDGLLVTGTEEPEGIAKVKEMASKIYSEAPYRISPHLFVYKNGKFERFRR